MLRYGMTVFAIVAVIGTVMALSMPDNGPGPSGVNAQAGMAAPQAAMPATPADMAEPALAEEEMPVFTTASAPTTKPGYQLRLASELGRLGLRTGDPLALAVAARYLANVEITPPAGEASQWATTEKSRFLDVAEELSLKNGAPNSALSDFIAAIRAQEAPRNTGHALELMLTDEVQPASTASFTLRIDQPTEILLVGDGGSDLDLEITSGRGFLLCRSSGYSDREYCLLEPQGLETLTMRVANNGRLPNRFMVIGG